MSIYAAAIAVAGGGAAPVAISAACVVMAMIRAISPHCCSGGTVLRPAENASATAVIAPDHTGSGGSAGAGAAVSGAG